MDHSHQLALQGLVLAATSGNEDHWLRDNVRVIGLCGPLLEVLELLLDKLKGGFMSVVPSLSDLGLVERAQEKILLLPQGHTEREQFGILSLLGRAPVSSDAGISECLANLLGDSRTHRMSGAGTLVKALGWTSGQDVVKDVLTAAANT